MQGLRLFQKCFTGPVHYGIRDIVTTLTPELSELYCVAHENILDYGGLSDEQANNLDAMYASLLLEELDQIGNIRYNLKLFDRGFLTKFRNQLMGDWTNFYLVTGPISLATIQPWTFRCPHGVHDSDSLHRRSLLGSLFA